MCRYRDVSTFQRHLSQQHLLDSDTTLCPVPSCGMHKFSPYELATHLVLFHHLPVVGTLRSVETNTLRLPTLDKDGGLDLMLVHNGGSAVPSKRSTSDDDDQAGPSKKPQIDTNHERPGITPSIKKYHCTGCCQPVKDITKHFITSALASLCRKRHAFFQLSDDGRKIGPFTFELPTVRGLLLVLTLVLILIIRIPRSLARLPRGVGTIIAHHVMSCLLTYVRTYQTIALQRNSRSRNQRSIVVGETALSTYLRNGFSLHHLCCSYL